MLRFQMHVTLDCLIAPSRPWYLYEHDFSPFQHEKYLVKEQLSDLRPPHGHWLGDELDEV